MHALFAVGFLFALQKVVTSWYSSYAYKSDPGNKPLHAWMYSSAYCPQKRNLLKILINN